MYLALLESRAGTMQASARCCFAPVFVPLPQSLLRALGDVTVLPNSGRLLRVNLAEDERKLCALYDLMKTGKSSVSSAPLEPAVSGAAAKPFSVLVCVV